MKLLELIIGNLKNASNAPITDGEWVVSVNFCFIISCVLRTNACGDNWLFFGDRTEANDFLYSETLTTWEKQGKLRLSLAWSRDPNTPKTYVQDLMLQQGEDIFKQLEKGAYFYICGDASKMAKDVDAALLEIVSTHGAMAIEKATAYINDLKKNKRYVRDVY